MGNSPYTTLILIVVMVVAFYFLILRPNRKRQQNQQKALNALTPGTRVMTGSGLFGTILSIGDKQAVLELAPGVEVTVLKQAIARPARPEDEDSVMNADDADQADDEADQADDEIEEPSELDQPLEQTTDPYATGADSTGVSAPQDENRELGSPFDRPSATTPTTGPQKREDS